MTAGAPSIGGLKRLSLYLAGQLKSAVAITGGTINGTAIGGTTPAAGAFTTLASTSSSSTGGYTAKSGTAVPASAGAIAAGAPITMFSTGIKLWVTSDTPAFSATKGDLCINTGGSSSSTRLYINNGTTNWVAITTAS